LEYPDLLRLFNATGVAGLVAVIWTPRGSRQATARAAAEEFDGAYRDRTGDLRLAKPALSQLS
jgi:hypothetical protein